MSRYLLRRLLIVVPSLLGISVVLFTVPARPVARAAGLPPGAQPYSLLPHVDNSIAFIVFSLPPFFTGILFILIFSIYLDWLPLVCRADIAATGWRWYWEMFRQAIMPV